MCRNLDAWLKNAARLDGLAIVKIAITTKLMFKYNAALLVRRSVVPGKHELFDLPLSALQSPSFEQTLHPLPRSLSLVYTLFLRCTAGSFRPKPPTNATRRQSVIATSFSAVATAAAVAQSWKNTAAAVVAGGACVLKSIYADDYAVLE